MGEASRFASSTRATEKRFVYYGDAYAPNGELGTPGGFSEPQGQAGLLLLPCREIEHEYDNEHEHDK